MRRGIAICAALCVVSLAWADFADDFESYADTAAMQAVWTGTIGTLDTVQGNPGQSIYHPGSTSNIASIPAVTVAAAAPVVWEFDLYDDAAGNKRIVSRLPDTGGGFLDFGMYNDLVNPDDVGGAHVSGYGMRIYGYGGEGWRAFPGLPTTRAGWHHLKATIYADQIVFELFLSEGLSAGGNPMPATYATYTSPRANDGLTFNTVRFGGASNLSSAGGGAWMDNMNIQSIPEPASLLLLGALALLRRR